MDARPPAPVCGRRRRSRALATATATVVAAAAAAVVVVAVVAATATAAALAPDSPAVAVGGGRAGGDGGGVAAAVLTSTVRASCPSGKCGCKRLGVAAAVAKADTILEVLVLGCWGGGYTVRINQYFKGCSIQYVVAFERLRRAGEGSYRWEGAVARE